MTPSMDFSLTKGLVGGFNPTTQSLWLTDIAHHHLAIAVVFIVTFTLSQSLKHHINNIKYYYSNIDTISNMKKSESELDKDESLSTKSTRK